MKKHLLILSLAAAQIFAVQAKAQNNNEQPYTTKTFANATVQSIAVNTSGGSISVAGANAAETRVEVYIHGNNNRNLSHDELQQLLNENYELSVDFSGNKITATARQKDRNLNWKKSLSIAFKVYVPKAVSTDLQTSGGSINLVGLAGNEKFTTSGGSLSIDDVSGEINGSTSGGSITVSNAHNDIDLSTSGGSIDASNCDGNIELETSGGSLHLDALKGTIKANTSGGSIKGGNIEGALSTHTSGGSVKLENLSCSVDASTSGGSMSVQVIKLGEYVRVSNSGGNIDLQLPKDKGLDLHLEGNKIQTGTLTNFNGNTEDGKMEGTINGGTSITVKAGSGKISLSLE